MDLRKKRKQIHVTLHPADQEKLLDYCKKNNIKKGTVVGDMAHCCINGIVRRVVSQREYLDVS